MSAKARWLLRLRLVHPFPTLLNVIAVIVLALIASGGRAPVGLVARMAVTMFFIQCAIGATNDYIDRDLDARSKSAKPIVAGVISPQGAAIISVVCVLVAALLGATLGLANWLLAMLGMGLGLSYNAYLKRTALSALPYLVAIPLVPVWVWLTAGADTDRVLWLLPLGALAGLGLHLMNALTDFESDSRDGIPGLAQWLGYRRALISAWGSVIAAFLLALALAPAVVTAPSWVVFGAGCGLALVLIGIVVYRVRPGRRALQLNFGLLAVATIIACASWLAG